MTKHHLTHIAVLSAGLLLSACAGGGAQKAGLHPSEHIASGPLTRAKLTGVAPRALEARLGKPDFKRSSPIGAEVWQYGGGGCSLLVYFYRGLEGELGSTYVDARKTQGGKSSLTDCLAAIERSRVPIS